MIKNFCTVKKLQRLPTGFNYLPSFLSFSEKDRLLSIIQSNSWCSRLKRMQQYYGIKYFQTTHLDTQLQNKTSVDHFNINEFDFIIDKVKQKFEINQAGFPNQILVNKYLKTDRLGLHVEDTEAFGQVIIGISLGSHDYLRLVSVQDRNKQLKIGLADRSIYILEKEARYKWMHGIGRTMNGEKYKGKDFCRISLTLRNVIDTRRKL